MVRKKILSLILMVGVVGGISAYAINYHNSSMQNIKVMAYKPSAQTNEKGYQIDKYQNIESAAWINDNEVLTLTKKGEFKTPDSMVPINYCSIYNLNTKSSKDFKEVNIDEFMGVSPDKKYVLYSEARTIPKCESPEWQKALDSGELLHKNVKLLNLSTGEITNVNTERLNSDAQFIWISKNKILANYFEKWAIIDTTGKVYANGSYNAGKFDNARISGVDDIKDLGTTVEGKFYYTQSKSGKEGVKLCTADVKTKETKTIFSNQYAGMADKKSKTIIIDHFNNNGEQSPDGVFVNRTFGAIIMDETGKQLQDIKLPKGKINNTYVVSPDGSKVAYEEGVNHDGHTPPDPDTSIKIIDTKTGAIKEIVNGTSLKDKDAKIEYRTFHYIDKNGKYVKKKIPVCIAISNICWDSTSTALSFTYGNYRSGNSEINTYIVSLDK
ncbi:hypothetical protein K2F40_08130 [Clostridium sp. CM028]|uniref:hypothetical protein n=1 Tax=unclassified Clostridium TaxID=2614128 RepID=UPI001C6ED4D4|nr:MULTISPECIES: hypothetical protein [unclassified Clostridium]MBW9145568.1 hypothetical protein [Clostridium sp. CM027]MBW9148928.1 hypothetical protein [Clostridium sp. CM028]UVE42400.1 hypothetical protein KTC92_08220 [Clostridium sp. CM027]WLC62972.1 hypothetical protein KTC94_06930 [Clostridium sp. CM028]